MSGPVGGPGNPDGTQDSLHKYYSEYLSGDTEKYAFQNCLDDYAKLDNNYKNVWHAGQTQQAIDAERDLACHYKHIWIAPRPPRSEWTGGVYGIDEEKCDGVDNDGDGWIDEDLEDRRVGACWN